MFYRSLNARLDAWRRESARKPLLLDGARQVGKSFLLNQIFAKDFPQTHRFDLLAEPELHQAFAGSLRPQEVLDNLQVLQGRTIGEEDLIIFDEVGECPLALQSLKFFAEERPKGFLCVTGSNIGLLQEFPVGKVRMEHLFPLTFEEFVAASGEEYALEAWRKASPSQAVHSRLWPLLLDYYFVGGMPEAVAAWFDGSNAPVNERIQQVQHIHRELIAGYERDFGKYAGRLNALDVTHLFHSVAPQLQQSRDASVKRYRFNQSGGRRRAYSDLRNHFDLLEKTRLIHRCHIIPGKPQPPFRVQAKDSLFKLFLLDVGLLGHELDISYRQQREQEMSYKGFIAENFVGNELLAAGAGPLYSWTSGRSAEIEFIHRDQQGEVIPVEVKNDRHAHAKSLAVYKDRYRPQRTLKLIGGCGGEDPNANDMVWPLYYAAHIAKL